jgi:hypothetical protein
LRLGPVRQSGRDRIIMSITTEDMDQDGWTPPTAA